MNTLRQTDRSAPTSPAPQTQLPDEWTVADVVDLLRKRSAWILGGCAACLALMTIYCLVATPRYESKGEIEVQKERAQPFGLESSVMGDAMGSSTDALDYNVTLETQVSILQSDTLALQVIEQQKLEPTRDFFGRNPHAFALPAWMTFWRRPLEPLSIPLEFAPNRRYVALKIFDSHLHVKALGGTRLIEIAYQDRDPERAARVVNALIQALIGYSFEARYTATAQASNWLAGQLSDLKKETESLQAKAIRLQRATGMFGDDESHNIVLSRLEALNQTLAAAESNRILKEAIYRTAQGGDPELISGLSGNAAQSTGVQNSLALIQTLRAQETSVKAEIALDQDRYGGRYPKMMELRSELSDVENSIAQEVHRLGERARTDYEIAERAEAAARASFDQQKALVNELNDKAVAYALTKQEADDSRNLYESLLGKLKQAGILEGLSSTNMNVVNPGRIPSTNHPKTPNFPLYEAIALAAGLFLGSMAALLRELTDQHLSGHAEVERWLGEPVLATIPLQRSKPRVPMAPDLFRCLRSRRWPLQTGHYALTELLVPSTGKLRESFGLLRTAIQLARGGYPARVILVTSPAGGEGKTTVAAQLAQSFGWQHAKVLLVEADFRSHGAALSPSDDVTLGLSQTLSGLPPTPIRQGDLGLPNVEVLPRGEVPQFPAELLGGPRMSELIHEWRNQYDYIVLDGPAYLTVSDGALLTQEADATLLVLRQGQSRRGEVSECLARLGREMPAQSSLGVVWNGVHPRRREAGYAMVH
jgi:polysaccharide biosynthesis transport protein